MKRSSDVGCDHLLIASGCLGDVHKAIELCKISDKYYTTAGIHPCRAAELNKGDPYKYLADLKD